MKDSDEYHFAPHCLDGRKGPFYSAEGYFLPCCQIDDNREGMEEIREIFHKKNLHIDNIENPVEDVFKSDEWLEFFDIISETPEFAPRVFREICSTKSAWRNPNYFDPKKKSTNDS